MDAETQILQTPTGGDFKVAPVETVCKTLILERKNDENGQHEMKEESSDPVRLHFNPSDSLVYIKNGPAIGIAISPTEEVREVYLKNMFMMPPNHEFYCPNCDVCINKVLYCTTQQKKSFSPQVPKDPVNKPPVTVPIEPKVTNPTVTLPIEPLVTNSPVTVPIDDPHDIECLVRCSTCFSLLIEKGKDFINGLVSRVPQGVEPGSGGDDVAVTITDTPNIPPLGPPPIMINPESRKGWEILKSIVYGGLAELLASLSVVTSAASADASTLSIVALGIANLIGGLSVLGHNLKDLKASQPREGSETDAQVDKYYELLGNRDNFYLHVFFAILSFLIFGLVPPIAYGFSFRESDDKDLKLAAVAGASLVCITLLGLAKAYIQQSNTFMAYFKTVTFYVTTGVVASLLTYEAGTLMKKLVEQLGWFEPKSNFGLTLPMMSIEKSGWGSY